MGTNKYKGLFKCSILSPKQLIYDKDSWSVFLTGDRGEYELLAYHYPVLGILKASDILINQEHKIPIRGGVVKFLANECTILVEEDQKKNSKKK